MPVIYKDIPGFSGYRAGDDGSVWSCWHRRGRGKARGCQRVILPDAWKQLRPCVDPRGRMMVHLCRDGAVHQLRVARVILLTFVGPCPVGMEACHFPDRNPQNNRVENLRWDTKQANMADKIAHGTDNRGEKNNTAILTAAQVIEIRRRAASGESRSDLAGEFGVGTTNIEQIVNRKTWKHVA